VAAFVEDQALHVVGNVDEAQLGLGAFQFALAFNADRLLRYIETFPTETGSATIRYKGTTHSFPDQSYPKFKGTGILSWSLAGVEARCQRQRPFWIQD
jgi:iron complex outermembrane receptor protein